MMFNKYKKYITYGDNCIKYWQRNILKERNSGFVVSI